MDEVMKYQFPVGFKPTNINQYDGTMDSAVWIEDFLMVVHIAGADDLHSIKYLPLKLKGSARHWLNSFPENSSGVWEDLEDEFCANFQGTYVRPRMSMTSRTSCKSRKNRSKNSGIGS